MDAVATILVVLAGALNAVQSGSNAQLARSLGRPWLVGVSVSLITAGAFGLAFLATGARLPEAGRLGGAPWWAWTGGLCGATYVAATLFFAERLGAGAFTALTVTAGIVTAVAIEHFGLVGFRQHSAGAVRIAGAALMVAGVVLVARS